SEDFDLWIRLARSGATLAAQDKVLMHRRFHEQNLTRDSIRMVGAEITVLEKVAALDDLDATERATVNQRLRRLGADLALERGKEHFRECEFDRARCEIARANEVHQSPKLTFVLLGLRLAPNLLHRIDRLRFRLPRLVVGRGAD
ncbi:MAG: hypothetical protein MUO50_02905, partial [Longimicrobiales bacterium]|nr:hypothetical protein [Longimicrobiales bacterium]